jgi:murein DD-endopeptidase MepM/ murein hydrolase activator NlpD
MTSNSLLSTPDVAPDPSVVPAKRFFQVGRSHPSFTLMGERFLVWLKAGVSKQGAVYTPGPGFSAADIENVKKCQLLMGDEPDGWFGQRQWTTLLTKKPPKPNNRSAIPVAGLRVTQGFGVKNPRYAAGEHTGVDFGDSGDDAIRCVADGAVVIASFDFDGWGNYVVVKHAGDRYSWYCHLARKRVAVGERIQAGQVVGEMGSTGNSTSKHLHYQETLGGTGYRDYVKPALLNT